MLITFTIHGEPASKANSRQIVKFGERTAMVKGTKALSYERDALRQIPPACRLQIDGPVRVTMRIFYATERPDLDESLILDILQDRYKGKGEDRVLVQRGVYRNDRQVREKHVFHAIDRKNPRAEITVESISPQPMLIDVEPRFGPARPKPSHPGDYGTVTQEAPF